jgi:hypothetical protein
MPDEARGLSAVVTVGTSRAKVMGMSKTKHTPIIELANARRALESAREECPHWDFESDGDGHECCYRVDDAKRRFRLARKAVPA